MGSIPVIKVVNISSQDRALILEHECEDRELELGYAGETLKYVMEIWGRPVHLRTRIKHRWKTIICNEDKKLVAID
jgi:stage V sporulation protein R